MELCEDLIKLIKSIPQKYAHEVNTTLSKEVRVLIKKFKLEEDCKKVCERLQTMLPEKLYQLIIGDLNCFKTTSFECYLTLGINNEAYNASIVKKVSYTLTYGLVGALALALEELNLKTEDIEECFWNYKFNCLDYVKLSNGKYLSFVPVIQ